MVGSSDPMGLFQLRILYGSMTLWISADFCAVSFFHNHWLSGICSALMGCICNPIQATANFTELLLFCFCFFSINNVFNLHIWKSNVTSAESCVCAVKQSRCCSSCHFWNYLSLSLVIKLKDNITCNDDRLFFLYYTSSLYVYLKSETSMIEVELKTFCSDGIF